MTKIKNIFNDGSKSGAKVGMVSIAGGNVFAETIVAAPTARLILVSDINQADFFNVAQTSAATDEVDLPDAAEVGTQITLYTVSAFELRTETETYTINNVASTGYTSTAGDKFVCTKTTATNWEVLKTTILGAAVTVVAGVAA